MKRVVVLLMATLLVAGCVSNMKTQNFRVTPEYQEWRAIDTTHLTDAQNDALARFKGPVELSEFDYRLMAEFPWINPKHLTVQDKVFLAEQAEVIVEAIQFANR